MVGIVGDLRSDNGDAVRAWCVAGMGITLRETWDIHAELHDGRLVRVLPEWESTPSTISIVRVRRESLPRRVAAFVDFLAAQWRKAPWDAER